MSSSLRCKVAGCDLDPCGVCRRCGMERDTTHAWKEVERRKPCYQLKVCEKCRKERESPDHDWVSSTGPAQDIKLSCSRCGLSI